MKATAETVTKAAAAAAAKALIAAYQTPVVPVTGHLPAVFQNEK
jgi:hypothetical protein